MTDILLSTQTTATATSNGDNDVYEPRRSSRVKTNTTTADGDTWHEKLVVCEASGGKLVIRSYFRNGRTGKRVWDEPPSGASLIEPATAARRQEAEEELNNLQIAMDGAPQSQSQNNNSNNNKNKSSSSKKGKGFFSIFKKKKDKNAPSVIKNKKKIPDVDADGDEDMQRAISLSLGITPGADRDSNEIYSQHEAAAKYAWQEDKEALEMAKAISMSEAEAGVVHPEINSEDEMLQRAIEESRMAAMGVASLPSSRDGDLLGVIEVDSGYMKPHAAFQEHGGRDHHDEDSEFFNQKMPAKPALKAPPSISDTSFDPYAVSASQPSTAAAHSAPAEASLSYSSGNNFDTVQDTTTSSGLRKMDETSDEGHKKKMGFGRRMFSKKTMEAEAGVV